LAAQGCARAFGDGLFGQGLLIGRHRVGLDYRVVVIVQIEQVRRYSHANRISFAAVSINFNPHDTLLKSPDS